MTMAGVTCRGSIWRWLYTTDDNVGGADPTGSYIYNNVYASFQEQKEEQLILQQGRETRRIFNANVFPSWYDIREGDEFLINLPTDHSHYDDRFRIINVRPSSHNRRDPRGYIMLTMSRSEESHDRQ